MVRLGVTNVNASMQSLTISNSVCVISPVAPNRPTLSTLGVIKILVPNGFISLSKTLCVYASVSEGVCKKLQMTYVSNGNPYDSKFPPYNARNAWEPVNSFGSYGVRLENLE